MAGYGWEEYDVRNGGRQVIYDAGNKIDLTIDFVKIPGGSNGGSWGARIKGTPREDASANPVTTLLFYAGMEGLGQLEFTNEPANGHEGSVTIHGQAADLGEFDIEVTESEHDQLPHKTHASWDQKPLDKTLAASMQVPSEGIWQAKNAIFSLMKQEIDAYISEYGENNMPPPWQAFSVPNDIKDGNFHVVQKVLVGAFEFNVIFNSASSGEKVTPETLAKSISSCSKKFKSKYQEVLKPAAPFDKPKYTKFAEAMFSNLFGGIGYFYGDSIVDRSNAPEYDEDNEGFWEETAAARARGELTKNPQQELFTSVPSRPFFPRGFLWDEGFHLVPIVEWDIDVSMAIVQSWFNLMDEDGWIAREQILGPEARSKVPQEFTVQYPHYANPPTLFMIIDTFIDKLNSKSLSSDEATNLQTQLQSLYPLLKRQYTWFRRTQFGDIKSYDRTAFSTKEAYRWRGRTPRHILTSGLDDYPRAQPPHPGELHLDLISWMGLMTRTLHKLSILLDEHEDTTSFSTSLTAITRNIDDLHWSASSSAYCDASIDDYDESIHVCHLGYISLFPFMTSLLPPDHPSVPHVLNLIASPDQLWSPYGIRSLSPTNPLYGTDENYWRSPIWVNMNYLIVKNLLAVATADDAPKAVKEQARKLYVDLRRNLVENVFREWERTGFAWEQYNPETGEGQRTQHFTGWTSLVCVIMKMPDLSKAGEGIKHGEL